jgi:DNA-binding NarL/FixJ family response regulator
VSLDEEWLAAVEELKQLQKAGKDVRTVREYGRFYQLSLQWGARVLRARARELGVDACQDLVADLATSKLELLIAADRPRAYFVTALSRRAQRLVQERRRTRLEPDPDASVPDSGAGEDVAAFHVTVRQRLAMLAPREQQVVGALARGVSREEIARELGISRAGVDQILSRLRRRTSGDGGDP